MTRTLKAHLILLWLVVAGLTGTLVLQAHVMDRLGDRIADVAKASITNSNAIAMLASILRGRAS